MYIRELIALLRDLNQGDEIVVFRATDRGLEQAVPVLEKIRSPWDALSSEPHVYALRSAATPKPLPEVARPLGHGEGTLTGRMTDGEKVIVVDSLSTFGKEALDRHSAAGRARSKAVRRPKKWGTAKPVKPKKSRR